MVPLPSGLSVVRRFQLTGQAKYLFIPSKGKAKHKKINNGRNPLKQGEEKQMIIIILMIQNCTECNNRQAIVIPRALLDRITLAIEKGCKINSFTHINK